MSGYVFRLNLQAVLTKPVGTEEERFKALGELISRRLQSMTTVMEDRGMIFEARSGDSLAMQFDDFAEGDDTGCYQFSRLWDDLCDYGESYVLSAGREKSLVAIPTLPQEFSC